MPDPEPQQSVELAADEDQAECQGSKEAKRRSEELRQKKRGLGLGRKWEQAKWTAAVSRQ